MVPDGIIEDRMKIKGDRCIFSTGTRLFANRGVIGIGPNLEVTEGWDGGFYNPSSYFDEEDSPLTPVERVELADFMIGQWKKFKKEAENA